MKIARWIVPVTSLFLLAIAAYSDEPVSSFPFQLQTFESHSRLLFQLDESISVNWKNTPKGFVLILHGVSSLELGATRGSEDQWKSRLMTLQDSRVQITQVTDSQKDSEDEIQISGNWKYPTGHLALAHPEMLTFDFREKKPSRYVIDFWLKKGLTIEQANALRRNEELSNHWKKEQELDQKRIQRKLASEKLEQQGIEGTRNFCHEPLSEKNDIFLQFFPSHPTVDFSRLIPGGTADAQYTYHRPKKELIKRDSAKKESKESQYVRLTLDLYQRGDIALTLRTLDFFEKEYPHSHYKTEMKFLKANAHMKLGWTQDAEREFNQLVVDHSNLKVAQHSAIFLVRKYMERNAPVIAVDKFMWLIKNHSDSPISWVFHLGLAECFYSLHQSDRAIKEYRLLIEKAQTLELKAEAAARIGDIYFSESRYEQALGAYSEGNSLLGKELKKFPSFFLNWGEVYYQLRQYDRAKVVFENFLNDYPNFPSGWKASFRLGEILAKKSQIGTADPDARNHFYKTINQYPTSPGATLARLRLLPCDDHGGFNLDTQKKFFSTEAESFPDKQKNIQEIRMVNYNDFKILSKVRSLIGLADDEEVASNAMAEYKNTKRNGVKRSLAIVAHEYVRRRVKELLEEDRKFDALKYYTSIVDYIPMVNADVNLDYLLWLSSSAMDFGMKTFSEELFNKFRQKSGRKPAQQSGKSLEIHAGIDTEFLIKKSEDAYIQAKFLWIQEKSHSQSESYDHDYLNIKNLLENISDESPRSFEREIILGIISQKEGKLERAVEHVLKAKLLNESLALVAWLANLESQMGDISSAIRSYDQLEKKVRLQIKNQSKNQQMENWIGSVEETLGVQPVPSLESIILAKAEIYEKRGKWGLAAAAYESALDSGEGSRQIQYQYARSLLKQGKSQNREKAIQVLESLVALQVKSQDDEFWKKMAFEVLENMPRRGKK